MYLYEHIDRYDLKYPAFVPALPNILDEEVKEVDFFITSASRTSWFSTRMTPSPGYGVP